MARVVVVATSAVDREVLAEHVEADDELFVVAPAVEQSRLSWLTNDEGDARDRAQSVGESIAADAPSAAAAVDVKPDVPSQAVLDAMAEHHPDRIIVAVREGEDATWLEDDELNRVPGQISGVPVIRVEI
jgi:acetylglutamate kinase